MNATKSVRFSPLGAVCMGIVFVLCQHLPGGAAPAKSRSPVFEADGLLLVQAERRLEELLGYTIELRVQPDDAARRARPTLKLTVGDPQDLLNVVTSAYGVRWLWLTTTDPIRIAFISKRDYLGTPVGLRQALTDALPAEYRDTLVGLPAARNQGMEGRLARFSPEQLDTLRQLAGNEWAPLTNLPPDFGEPLLKFLHGHSIFMLGRACDTFAQSMAENQGASFRYGSLNGSSPRQFSFRKGRTFIGVSPGI